ncbi:centrosomin [Drosophila sulfurigaster albostrigata]|uniref:centrosomin n=1 Tax=Drosophila sulfurigaster albostrigata TaxID=89887 RepID=UPI002D21CE1F|nr:centrosomin [Drosophila sulfurigaster albostrigata]
MDQDQSKQNPRDVHDSDAMCTSSLKEISLIETMTSFLAENGAAEVDPRVLKSLAEALSKRINDTSPGGIQDATLENSYTSFDAGRAPGGIHSPLQGRSMRELEEQMSTLRKENFNLKLRIYFMEESQQGVRGKNTDESLAKQLIDSKIEIEVLRKRVDEKTELLKDAARAITQHEEIQKRSDIESQSMIEQMQQYIHQLESSAKQKATRKSLDVLSSEKLKSLEDQVLKLENALMEADLRETECNKQLDAMGSALADRQENLAACEAKIEELAIKNAELVEQLEKETEADAMDDSTPKLRIQLADKICELQDAQEKLAERERVHEKACRTIQKLMQKLNSQESEIKRMKQTQLVNRLLWQSNIYVSPSAQRHSLSDTETCTEDISHSLKQRYELQILEQDELIKQLQSEVKKKTANLQNLVNKELWEKNREVERLTKLVSHQQSVDHSGEDSTTGAELQHSFSEADYVKAVKRNKLLQQKADVLLHRLNEMQQNDALISQLRHDLHAMQADVESANKWRLECADVCSVLTNRLEELAGFLNSLLKHKDVLGVLAADRRHAMRRAIDRSLDLSKSLNMTLSVTGVSLADQSLAQLSKLSEILYTEADECNRTYNSHEEINACGTATVKQENKLLKSDGQLRKERRSLPLPQQQQDNQSESEAWSEPDRKVSLARIGLEDTSSSFVYAEKHRSESDSEGHACSVNSLKQERSRNSEKITQLESLIAQRDERILQAQCQLVDADNRLKQEQLRVIEVTQQLEKLRAQNETLIADLQAIGSQDDREIVELQQLIEQKTQQIDQLQLAQNTLRADAQITELELKEAQQKIAEMDEENTASLERAHAELTQYQREAAQRLEELQKLQQEELARNWVALTKYEEVKTQIIELQRSVEFYQESEKELKQMLVENELTARSLKKEVDESTLQASKAIVERTKAYNDKLQLEKRLDEMKVQLTLLQDEQRLQQQQQQYPQCSRINSIDASQSGYTSEEVPLQLANNKANVPSSSAAAGRINNPSPDLGIESDVGRGVSVELSNAQRALLKTVELTANNEDTDNMDLKEDSSPDSEAAAASSVGQITIVHDCAKVEKEMAELKRKLLHTKRSFEDTYKRLCAVNKAKAQVEKDIKNQILKTHNVLRNVRSNMENVL